MPDNTFERYKEKPSTRRTIILVGVVVIVLCVIAVVCSAIYSALHPDPEQPDFSLPESTGTGPTGMYSGTFSTPTIEDSSDWDGVLALTGAQGLLTYPSSDCQVYLSNPREDNGATTYDATSLTSACTANGTWRFTPTDSGLNGEYSDEESRVTAVLTSE